MPDRPGTDVRLRNGPHLKGGLHPDGDPLLLADVRHCQTVHNRSQHTDVIGAGPLHFAAAAVLGAPPEVAAADDQTHLNAHVQTLLDDVAHLTNDLKIQTGMLVSRKGLAADLQ